MNGRPNKSFDQICEEYAKRCTDYLAESRELPVGLDELIASEIGDAINEYVVRYTDRLSRGIRLVESGGSFGLTPSQKRILLEVLVEGR